MFYDFDIMNKDTLVTSVKIFPDRSVKIERYVMDIGIQPFWGGRLDFQRVLDFISYRCFEEARPDKKEILQGLGLNEYNPWDIVEKTHGRLFEDFIWIRFPGEKISWKDISYGQN